MKFSISLVVEMGYRTSTLNNLSISSASLCSFAEIGIIGLYVPPRNKLFIHATCIMSLMLHSDTKNPILMGLYLSVNNQVAIAFSKY
jgi:hypothetical protein